MSKIDKRPNYAWLFPFTIKASERFSKRWERGLPWRLPAPHPLSHIHQDLRTSFEWGVRDCSLYHVTAAEHGASASIQNVPLSLNSPLNITIKYHSFFFVLCDFASNPGRSIKLLLSLSSLPCPLSSLFFSLKMHELIPFNSKHGGKKSIKVPRAPEGTWKGFTSGKKIRA